MTPLEEQYETSESSDLDPTRVSEPLPHEIAAADLAQPREQEENDRPQDSSAVDSSFARPA